MHLDKSSRPDSLDKSDSKASQGPLESFVAKPMIEESSPRASTNRVAVLSVVLAILATLSLCTAIEPIPFTGFLCFPAAIVLAGLAFAVGIASLARIRAKREKGRSIALIGTAVGAFTALSAACVMTAGVLVFSRIANLVQHMVH